RIVLISGEFSKEVTTSVLWLNERDVDIRCVRLRPYNLNDQTLLDIQQVIPLPEAAEYQVQLRKKEAEKRQSEDGAGPDFTRYDLQIKGQRYSHVWKRGLFLHSVLASVENGVKPEELYKFIPERKFASVSARCRS